jgi:hypothetical protein
MIIEVFNAQKSVWLDLLEQEDSFFQLFLDFFASSANMSEACRTAEVCVQKLMHIES